MASVTAGRCVRVILLACGSYNPITNMHLRMFELARDNLNSTGQYMVVGGIVSPVSDKYSRKKLASVSHRCAMIRLALQTSNWIRLDSWESEQPSWMETVKVLRHHLDEVNLSQVPVINNQKHKLIDDEASGKVHVKLLCGSDVLETFSIPGLWRPEDIEEIVSRFGMVVIARKGSCPEKLIYESDILSKYRHRISIIEEWIPNEISATRIRTAIRRNQSVKYLLQDSVLDYISTNQLYSATNNNCNSVTSLHSNDLDKFAYRRRVSPLSITRRGVANGQKSCEDSLQHFQSSNSNFSLSSELLRKSTPRSKNATDRRQHSLGPEVANAVDNHLRMSTKSSNNINNNNNSGVSRISRSQSADDCWRRRIPKGTGYSEEVDTARVTTTSGILIEASVERPESGNGNRRYVHRRHHRNLNLDEELRRAKSRSRDGQVHGVSGRGDAGKQMEEKQHTPGSDSAIVSDAPEGSQSCKRVNDWSDSERGKKTPQQQRPDTVEVTKHLSAQSSVGQPKQLIQPSDTVTKDAVTKDTVSKAIHPTAKRDSLVWTQPSQQQLSGSDANRPNTLIKVQSPEGLNTSSRLSGMTSVEVSSAIRSGDGFGYVSRRPYLPRLPTSQHCGGKAVGDVGSREREPPFSSDRLFSMTSSSPMCASNAAAVRQLIDMYLKTETCV